MRRVALCPELYKNSVTYCNNIIRANKKPCATLQHFDGGNKVTLSS